MKLSSSEQNDKSNNHFKSSGATTQMLGCKVRAVHMLNVLQAQVGESTLKLRSKDSQLEDVCRHQTKYTNNTTMVNMCDLG